MKKQCLDRFIANRAGKQQKVEEDIRKVGSQMVEEGIDKLIEDK